MIKCDHCGFGFADHRDDALCPTEGCPFMREDGAKQKRRAADKCRCGGNREAHQYWTGSLAECPQFRFAGIG